MKNDQPKTYLIVTENEREAIGYALKFTWNEKFAMSKWERTRTKKEWQDCFDEFNCKGQIRRSFGRVFELMKRVAWSEDTLKETLKERLHRLIAEGATKEELHTIIDQLEDNL
jgi:hypothetical protein